MPANIAFTLGLTWFSPTSFSKLWTLKVLLFCCKAASLASLISAAHGTYCLDVVSLAALALSAECLLVFAFVLLFAFVFADLPFAVRSGLSGQGVDLGIFGFLAMLVSVVVGSAVVSTTDAAPSLLSALLGLLAKCRFVLCLTRVARLEDKVLSLSMRRVLGMVSNFVPAFFFATTLSFLCQTDLFLPLPFPLPVFHP